MRKRSRPGYVYVASNPYYPGILKIGGTERSVSLRLNELSAQTGVLAPFREEMTFQVPCWRTFERRLHRRLRHLRISQSKEFFEADLLQVWIAASQVFWGLPAATILAAGNYAAQQAAMLDRLRKGRILHVRSGGFAVKEALSGGQKFGTTGGTRYGPSSWHGPYRHPRVTLPHVTEIGGRCGITWGCLCRASFDKIAGKERRIAIERRSEDGFWPGMSEYFIALEVTATAAEAPVFLTLEGDLAHQWIEEVGRPGETSGTIEIDVRWDRDGCPKLVLSGAGCVKRPPAPDKGSYPQALQPQVLHCLHPPWKTTSQLP